MLLEKTEKCVSSTHSAKLMRKSLKASMLLLWPKVHVAVPGLLVPLVFHERKWNLTNSMSIILARFGPLHCTSCHLIPFNCFHFISWKEMKSQNQGTNWNEKTGEDIWWKEMQLKKEMKSHKFNDYHWGQFWSISCHTISFNCFHFTSEFLGVLQLQFISS